MKKIFYKIFKKRNVIDEFINIFKVFFSALIGFVLSLLLNNIFSFYSKSLTINYSHFFKTIKRYIGIFVRHLIREDFSCCSGVRIGLFPSFIKPFQTNTFP